MKNTSNQKRNKIILLIALAIGIFCLYQIFVSYDWQLIWGSLQKSNFYLLICGSIISIVTYWFFRALRWQLLLANQDTKISFWQIYLITAVSVGISTITPFQSGEALKVEYLKKYGVDRFSGYGVFILERLLDLFVIVGLGILGISLGFDWQILQNYLYLFAGVLFFGGLLILFGIFYLPIAKFQPLRNWLKERWQSKFQVLSAFILTLLSWLAVIAGWHIALKSVSVEISFLQSITVVSLTTLLAILSFVPGAIGVSELSISSILVKMDVPNSLAQTGAISIRLYALMILLLILFHWLILLSRSPKK